MGGAFLSVMLVAACIGLLVSLVIFRSGPAWARRIFFQPSGAWRRLGQAAWLLALAVLLVLAVLVTPSGA
jgi:hypothetical protein